VERIGILVEGKPRPLRVRWKRLEGKKEMLARAKMLKKVEKFNNFFLSPDSARKHQEKDRELRRQLKFIRETGMTGLHNNNGKEIRK
jgi:hypothetical protein